MKIFTPSSNAHWYFIDGSPCHQVENKSKPGTMRNTTVTDARKLGLLPSVTGIVKQLDRPMLNAWRCEQAVLAALTLPKNPDENDTDFAHRVAADAESIVEKAANRGVRIHNAIEMFLTIEEKTDDPEIRPLVDPFYDWAKANIERIQFVEQTVVSKMGYAGRLDLKAEFRGLGWRYADYKSRKAYNGKIRAYPEDGYQLAAYKQADGDSCRCTSIFINSEVPEAPTINDWEGLDIFESQQVFNHLFEIWKLTKRYNPEIK